MRSLTYISDNGTEIHFCAKDPFADPAAGPYYFNTLKDSAGATAEISRAVRQDGQRTGHVSLDGRTVIITGQVYALGDKSTPVRALREQNMDYLHKAFRPNTFGRLIYHRETDDVMIRARAVGTPTPTEDKNPSLVGVSIDMVTDMPNWVLEKETVVPLGGKFKLWHFPWSPRKQPWGLYRRRGIINNTWVEDIYPTIEIYDTSKIVSLFNDTTGAFLTVEHEIPEGQKMVIDTRLMSAKLYERDDEGNYIQVDRVSHYISIDSSKSFPLVPGRNVVRIKNEDDTMAPLSFLRFNMPVGGV